jgi:hypothetical protein
VKGVVPIIWDDMLRTIPSQTLSESGLGKLVEPMIWVYIEDIDRFIDPVTWSSFAETFPHMWTASAFKVGSYIKLKGQVEDLSRSKFCVLALQIDPNWQPWVGYTEWIGILMTRKKTWLVILAGHFMESTACFRRLEQHEFENKEVGEYIENKNVSGKFADNASKALLDHFCS